MATAVAPDVELATEVLTVDEVQDAARLAVAGLELTSLARHLSAIYASCTRSG